MAFMDFGSFLKGMRLSASDIADREKAELNKRYMDEQMQTMALGRESTMLQMDDARQQMERRPVEWAQEDFTFGDTINTPIRAGRFAPPTIEAPDEAYNSLAAARNEQLRKVGQAPVPPQMIRIPVVGADGKQTGYKFQFADESGKGVGPVYNNADDAAEAGATTLNVTSGVTARKKQEAETRRLREQNAGSSKGYGKNPEVDKAIAVQARAASAFQKALAVAQSPQLIADLGIDAPEAMRRLDAAEADYVAATNDLRAIDAIMNKDTGETFRGPSDPRKGKTPPPNVPAGTPGKDRVGEKIDDRQNNVTWRKDKNGRWFTRVQESTSKPVRTIYYDEVSASQQRDPAAQSRSGRGSNVGGRAISFENTPDE